MTKEATCFHCGDYCRKDHIVFEGKDFCCNGCKTVYEILNRNGMCNYYDLEKNPGTTIRNTGSGEQFNFLDNEEIRQNILSFRDDKISKVNFHIPSIHCSSCIWLLENLSRLEKGIISSRVNFNRKEVSIVFHHDETPLREVALLLSSIGYEPYISLEEGNKDRYSARNRELLIKIGISGFSFGNTMLLSFPEYFGFEGINDIFLLRLITWLNVALSIPVILYCAREYFISAYAGFRQRFINIDIPISIGIIALFGVSIFQVISARGPGYFDSLTGLIFFLLIGKWIQNMTYERLSFDRDYKSYFPMAATRIKNDRPEPVPAVNLQKGETILVKNKEIIPADGILLDETAHIDYSFISGESTPVTKVKGDLIYAGGRQAGTSIRLSVVKPVSQSYLTQLWNNDEFGKKKPNEFQRLVDATARYFTVVILVIAAGAFFFWAFYDLPKAGFIFTAVLIVACPCALAMATPFTLGNAMRVFGRNHFYIKNIQVAENLTRINHIVFDKTGTLTESSLSKTEYHGAGLTDEEKDMVNSVVMQSAHPISRMIMESLSAPVRAACTVNYFEEMPGAGIIAGVNDRIIRVGSARLMKESAGISDEIRPDEAPGYSVVFLSIDNVHKGEFHIRNRFRSGIPELTGELDGKFTMSVLSGDTDAEQNELGSRFPKGVEMFFRQSPEDKLNYIKQLRQQGKKVMMLGDGLNDAGALNISDVGIAVTDDVNLFTPASDIIMDGRKLRLLPLIIRFSHTAKKVIIACFVISFLYNIIGLGFAVTGHLSPVVAAILMPASSISVVLFSTFMINLLARIYYRL